MNAASGRYPGVEARAAVWDCHVHVFDPAYTFAAIRAYTPGPATAAELERHLEQVGASHAVLVQASPHGTDNSGLLDALERLGPQHRGVIAVAPGLESRALANLHARGVRGLRLNPLGRIGTADERMRREIRLAARLAADSGLALEISASATLLTELSATLTAAPCDLVIAHLAGLAAPEETADTRLRVRDLLVRENIWVKLSGFDRFPSEAGLAAASLLLEAIPERLVWGSDWPHTPFHDGIVATDLAPSALRPVDDHGLKVVIAAHLGPATERVFSGNPARLYG